MKALEEQRTLASATRGGPPIENGRREGGGLCAPRQTGDMEYLHSGSNFEDPPFLLRKVFAGITDVVCMVGRVGIEPTTYGLKVRYSTN